MLVKKGEYLLNSHDGNIYGVLMADEEFFILAPTVECEGAKMILTCDIKIMCNDNSKFPTVESIGYKRV